jgi:hypothetical protein
MRLIHPAFHRILDFVTVAAFAMAPTLLGLGGPAAVLAYVLAAVHLTMTLLTRFASDDRLPIVPRLHGGVELAVGILLVPLPWLAGWHGPARGLYAGAGAVIFLVWLFTQYRTVASRATA